MNASVPKSDVIVIGASAGGIEALLELAPTLPADLPAAILVVVHMPQDSVSRLPALLTARGPLPASHAEDGQPATPGHILVAPPGLHLTVQEGCARLTRAPRENGVRPAIDPLFRTAATCYRRRLVGILLSGTLDDGTAGLLQVKMRGGVTMVQSPDEALFTGMPASALRYMEVDYTLPLSGMAAVLTALAHGRSARLGGASAMREESKSDDDVVAQSRVRWEKGIDTSGERSVLTCPECGGVLWEMDGDTPMLRFECHTKHAYSADSLVSAQSSGAEASLWASVRRLEEVHSLALRLERHTRDHQDTDTADALLRRATHAKNQADAVRAVILHGGELEPEAGGMMS
jgi:two-component system chemotaxis response regulator CheB